MIKEQTKTLAGCYVAPQMSEHTLTVRRRILEGSLEGSLGPDATFGEESEF